MFHFRPFDCYKALGSFVALEAQEHVYCLSRTKNLFHHCFQSQNTELIEHYRFFQFHVLIISNALECSYHLQHNLKLGALAALTLQ